MGGSLLFSSKGHAINKKICTFASRNQIDCNYMVEKKTKEEALQFIKSAIQHKQEWLQELEEEF